jgi:hypothetical protein
VQLPSRLPNEDVAQWQEHFPPKEGVIGSNPVILVAVLPNAQLKTQPNAQCCPLIGLSVLSFKQGNAGSNPVNTTKLDVTAKG